MAQVFVSPGVYTQEIDDTFRAPSAGAIGAALIGLTNRGQAFRPITVGSKTDFDNKFGSLSPDKYTPYAANRYLTHGSDLTVVRVLGRGTKSQGNVVVLAFPKTDDVAIAISATNEIAGILRTRTTDSSIDYSISGGPNDFAIKNVDTAEEVTGLSLSVASPNYIGNILSIDPVNSSPSDKLPDLYIDAIFHSTYASLAGNITTYDSATAQSSEYEQIEGGFSSSQTPWITSQRFGSEATSPVHNLFKIYSVGHGEFENTNIKVCIERVQTDDSDWPTFTLSIKGFKSDALLGSWDNLTLDPSSKNYIARVIGNATPSYDFSTLPPVVTYDGEFPVASDAKIRVVMGPPAPAKSRPSGFTGIPALSVSGHAVGDSVSRIEISEPNFLTDHKISGDVSANAYMGYDFDALDAAYRLKPTVTSASGAGSYSTSGLLLSTVATPGATNGFVMVDLTDATAVNQNDKIKFSVPLYGGYDGFDKRVDLRLASNEDSVNSISGEFEMAIHTLSNPDEIDFNLLAMPDIHSSNVGNVAQKALNMVENRGDAFLLIDLANDNTTTADGKNTTVAQAVTEANKYDSSYAACYYPWLNIPDISNSNGGSTICVPPSVAMMGVYAFSDRVADPWFAPAGFNRGQAFPGGTTPVRQLNQTNRDTLYQANVNPIAQFVNQGIAAFGQKTLQTQASVLDRVNVRRMLIEVRKTIAGLSRLFLFEPNTVTVRRNLLTQVNSYLSVVQQRQGLTEFRAVLDETTTTPDLIDRNIMKGKIFLKPTSAAEVILFDFTVTPQGASFSE